MTDFKKLTQEQYMRIMLKDDSARCECGWLLSKHPPITEPPMLTSWQARHAVIGRPPKNTGGWRTHPLTINPNQNR